MAKPLLCHCARVVTERKLELAVGMPHVVIVPNTRSAVNGFGPISKRAGDTLWFANKELYMPVYEYRCNDCAATFEVLRPMVERNAAAVCPRCESSASMPLISRVNAGIPAPTGGAAAYQSGGGAGPCCGGSCGCNPS